MTNHFVSTSTDEVPIPAQPEADLQHDFERALLGLKTDPENRTLLLMFLRSAEALGLPDLAKNADERLRALPLEPETLEALITRALRSDRLGDARSLAALAEGQAQVPHWAIAHAKARVARASNDLEAATAILVDAIEAEPKATSVRTLLTEILLARGSGGHARDVLAHLGMPPSGAQALPGQAKGDR